MRLFRLGLLAFLAVLGGCSVARLPKPPPEVSERAAVLGQPNSRFWVDRDVAPLVAELKQQAKREGAATLPGPDGRRPAANFLAISGGGDNGAFGAGLLLGWSACGNRPSFELVTGVSTGALIAPFAFLGSAYDEELRHVYTSINKQNVFALRRITWALLFGESLADTTPLYELIRTYADEAMLAAIGEQYLRGRVLLIGTVNLDLQRPVLWNIGALAVSKHPKALGLFRQILLASAAIPGAFPPVMIEIDADGHTYHEMHVDGGAASQVFLYPPTIDLRQQLRPLGPDREKVAWVIRNARMDPEWAAVDRQVFRIATRAVSTMIHFSGVNDVVRIFQTTRRDGIAFRLAYIGDDFETQREMSFDPEYMQALFDYGYRIGREGTGWRHSPPGFRASSSPSQTQQANAGRACGSNR